MTVLDRKKLLIAGASVAAESRSLCKQNNAMVDLALYNILNLSNETSHTDHT